MFFDAIKKTYMYQGAHVIVSRNGASKNFVHYKHNAATEEITKDPEQLRSRGTHAPKRMYELAFWCDANCQDDWLIGVHISGFNDDEDFLAFKLRWM